MQFLTKYEGVKPANKVPSNYVQEKNKIIETLEEICESLNVNMRYIREQIVLDDNESFYIDCELFTVILSKEELIDSTISITYMLTISPTLSAIIMKFFVSYFRGYEVLVLGGYRYNFDEEGNIDSISYEDEKKDNE